MMLLGNEIYFRRKAIIFELITKMSILQGNGISMYRLVKSDTSK
ncbi:hypothetical protein EVA_01377 [gut metagenome]|uniref:Uncharacterized protein n=1 Tax=gut metagenome TaxID=749906 RepID=J9DBS4_9ZZZZ